MDKSQREKFTEYVHKLKDEVVLTETTVKTLEDGETIKDGEEIILETTSLKTTDEILADLIQTLIDKNII
jgi:hypothetical protein